MSQTIVIDFATAFPDFQKNFLDFHSQPAPGLLNYIKAAQRKGSTVFFVNPAAHDAYMRQRLEWFIEQSGINSVFVTHGLPEGYDLFISNKAYPFKGEFPSDEHQPVQT